MNDDLSIDVIIEPSVDRVVHCAVAQSDCIIDVSIDVTVQPLMCRCINEHMTQSMIRSSIID
jgi:hypothetical protein